MKLSPEEQGKPESIMASFRLACVRSEAAGSEKLAPEEAEKRQEENEAKLIEARRNAWAELEKLPAVKPCIALRKQFEAILTPEQRVSYHDMAISASSGILADYFALRQIGETEQQFVALKRLSDQWGIEFRRFRWESGGRMLKVLTPAQQEKLRDLLFPPVASQPAPAAAVEGQLDGPVTSEPAKSAGPSDGLPIGGNRGQAAKKATPDDDRSRASEPAIAAALDWLRRHQSPDGSWSLDHFTDQCKDDTCDYRERRPRPRR